MCGIVATLNKGPAGEKENILKEMLAPMRHRGPDEWGLYVGPEIGIGHLRLSIIDLQHGHQPMNTARSVLAFNGELYNYIELRKELEECGRTFVTSSDTEVVQQAIEQWGPSSLKRFNGQFSILFWDKKTNQLIAARDRFGIRPLYYLAWAGDIYFASEMKAFDTLKGFRRQWHPQNLFVHGLMWNTLGEKTVYKGIYSLPPGHYAVFSDQSKIEEHVYYDIGMQATFEPEDLQDGKEQLRELLGDSVRLRLRSDVPVGCYLSGGIDSSVISLLVKEIQKERFKTFSIAFTAEEYDESSFQDEMIGLLGSDGCKTTINLDDIDANFLEAAYHFERPVFRTAPVPLYLLSKCVNQQGIKVVLTGEAADEILCGYDTFKEIQMLQMWEKGASRDDIQKILKNLYPHLSHYQGEDSLGFLEMYYEGFLGKISGPSAGLAIRIHNNQILANYLNKDWKVCADLDLVESEIETLLPEHVRNWSLMRRNQYLEMKTLLSGYLLSSQGDRMAMENSVEGRFPFLDHRLVDWAFQLPDSFKLNGMEPKFILKEAFREEIPDIIVNRPKQPYMAPDLISFIRNGVPTEIAGSFLSSEKIEEYGIFDPKMVARLLFKYRRRQADEIGYRDNMLISFILSAQMVEWWIQNPKIETWSMDHPQVRIIES